MSAMIPEIKDKMSLGEILNTFNEIMAIIMEAGGEITEESDSLLAVITEKAAKKVDGFKFILDKLESESAFWKAQAEERLKVSKQCINMHDKLKGLLQHTMENNKLTEIKGDAFEVRLQPTQGSVVYDDNLIGPEYMIETKVIAIDKKKIRQDIDAGKNVVGAQLKPGVSLRFYKAKSR